MKLIPSEKSESQIVTPKMLRPFNTSTTSLFAIIIIASLLRLYHLEYRSVWLDEATQFFISTRPLLNIKDLGHPPLSHYLLHFWLFLGKNDLMLRLPSVFFGVGSIIFIFLLGKYLFDERTALFGSFFASISPFLIYYSQEARMYSQFLFFSTASLFFFLLTYHKGSLRYYTAYGISTILSLYTHFFSLFVILAHNFVVFLSFRKSKLPLKNWLGIQMILLILFIPGFMLLFETIREHSSTTSFNLIPTLSSIFYIFSFGRVFLPIKLNILIIAIGSIGFLILFILGILDIAKNRNWKYLFFLSYTLTFLSILFVNFKFKAFNEQNIRYLIFFAPLYYVLISKGLTSIRNANIRRLALATILGTSAFALYPYYFEWDRTGKGNFRGAAEYIDHNLLTEDDIIFYSDRHIRKPFAYYLKRQPRQDVIDSTLPDIDKIGRAKRIFVVGYSEKLALGVIRGQKFEAEPWLDKHVEEHLSKSGYSKANEKSWAGKKRIDIFVYEKHIPKDFVK